jgi:hypothetical protein
VSLNAAVNATVVRCIDAAGDVRRSEDG